MKTYKVSEWEHLPFRSAGHPDAISYEDAVQIHRQAETMGRDLGVSGDSVLGFSRSGIRIQQTVGVIQAPACRLEILPKIDTAEDALVRRTLISMLAAIYDFPMSLGASTSVETQSSDLLEALISLFSNQLIREVHRGLPRQYIPHEADLTRLRGGLDVTRQFTLLAAMPGRLACRYDELSPDIPLNRILKAACRLLLGISRTSANQRRLRELLHVYDEVSDLALSAKARPPEIVLDRTNAAYRELLAQALLFLRMQWQSVYSGDGKGFALLFEMNTLFEEYVGRSLRKMQTRLNCRVQLQGPRDYALESQTGSRHFMTKPDICLEYVNGGDRVILDTKWKQLKRQEHSAPWGISNSDIYQMLAYAKVYAAGRVILLYPHAIELGVTSGLLDRFTSRDQAHQIDIATLDLTNLASIPDQLAELLAA